jgi:putative transposase
VPRRWHAQASGDRSSASTIPPGQISQNVVEQDQRAVKRVTRPMLGFKAFEAAQRTLAGIELMHMIRKRQLESGAEQGITVADPFYSLAD